MISNESYNTNSLIYKGKISMSRKSTILKTCQKCKKEKSLSDYNRNKTKKDGHNGICKDCQNEVNKNNK